MDLVIVESPAKAKTINGYLGKDYTVVASFGHIRELPSKDGSVDVNNNFAMNYQLNSKGKTQVKQIEKLARGADRILLATDPDREGEAISWHVVEVLKEKKVLKNQEVKRVVFNEITKSAVLDAIKNPRDLDLDLINAQRARLALDYLVGFTLSPVLWRKLPGSRSAGRVQSVAVKLIAEREDEIERFKSQEYWRIFLDCETFKNEKFVAHLTYYKGKKLEKFSIQNEQHARDIEASIKAKQYFVKDVEKKQVTRNPYPPFTTSSLQQEASRKLGFSAKKTMQTAQSLYEGVKIKGGVTGLITYMRTDGVQLASSAVDEIRKEIANTFGKEYLPASPRVYQSKSKNAQEAHEAIRPTKISYSPKDIADFLNDDQLRLYELIWKRTMACQMEKALLDVTSVDIASTDSEAMARATGSVIKFPGFLKIYKEDLDDRSTDQVEDNDNDDDRILPQLNEKDDIKVKKVRPTEHHTEPPPRYSEASLVKKLEELGIGRPSTYASIISVIQDRDYVRLEKKRFIPEERGMIVTAFLENFFAQLVAYDFTAQLEEELDQISDGKLIWTKWLGVFWEQFHATVEKVLSTKTSEIINAINGSLEHHLFPPHPDGSDCKKCPSCDGGTLGLKLGKYGAFVACSNYPDCSYTRQIADETENHAREHESFENRELGRDSNSGKMITLMKGPYGFYLELEKEDDEKKPKRASVPKNVDPKSFTLDQAIILLSLPREVGFHPESKEVIKANIGKFGPYLLYKNKFYSIPKDESVYTIGMNRAVDIIATKDQKEASMDPLKNLGKHPEKGIDLLLFKGRFGPYMKFDGKNYKLPKGVNIDEFDLQQGLNLLGDKKTNSKSKKTNVRKKKTK